MNISNGFETILISLGGTFCLYLGYRVFITGAEQQFQLFSDLKGWKLRIANTAPGIFFAILGTIIICSPVIVDVISIIQKESFMNTYATKLILEELQKRNEIILANRLNESRYVVDYSAERSSSVDTFASKKSTPIEKATVTASVLLLRKEPDTYHGVIGSLKKGDIVTIKDKRGSWYRVSTDEFQDGWIHGDYARPLQSLGASEQGKSSLFLSSNHSEAARGQKPTAE
jgi:hypothetical protein